MGISKIIICLIFSYLVLGNAFAQTCEEEVRAKSFVVLSLKIHQYNQEKTSHRLNTIYDERSDALFKKYKDGFDSLEAEEASEALDNERQRVLSNRLELSYKSPAICDKEEVQDLARAYLAEKSQLCKSDDRFSELDDMSNELSEEAPNNCPNLEELNAHFESTLPKDALSMEPKKACVLVFEVMKKRLLACEKAKKNAP
tara:strand:- start:654 stop:1253 length:600 start_codon:yes stop_codon:yes gene_type:complete